MKGQQERGRALFSCVSIRNISLTKEARFAFQLLILYFMLILLEQNIKSGMTYDASQQLSFINKWQWQWGYIETQPPLYHWLFKIVVDICNFLSLDFKFADSFFRQCLMMANILIGYLTLRQYKIDQSNAIFSVFGLFLISDIAWSLQYNYTHTALGLTTTLLFIFQFVRLLNRPTLHNYVFAGGTIVCALLSKYNTLLTILGMFLASLSIPSARNAILRFRFLITSSIAFLIFLPHLNWILSTRNPLITIRKILRVENANADILSMLINSVSIIGLFIGQVLPLLIALIVIFGLKYNFLKMIIKGNDNQALLGRSFMITVLIYLVFMMMFGAKVIHIHWLLPAVSLLPLALPLAFFRIGKINQYSKGIFIGGVIVKIICFIVMTMMDIFEYY